MCVCVCVCVIILQGCEKCKKKVKLFLRAGYAKITINHKIHLFF